METKPIELGGGLLAISINDTQFAVVSDIEYRQPACKPVVLAKFNCSSKAGATTIRSYGVKAAKAKGLL